MRNRSGLILRFTGIALALTLVVTVAVAGPPLICHPFAIGEAKSLPWASGMDAQDSPKSDYDVRRLPNDVVALLNEKAPVIVRMETIRRAALYSRKSSETAKELLNRLAARAQKGAGVGPAVLYLFDYGYLIETMKQAWLTDKSRVSNCPAATLNGLVHIQQALQLRSDNPQMEFAAAIVTTWPKDESHQEHLRRAVAGAGQDTLLMQNLASHFPDVNRVAAKSR